MAVEITPHPGWVADLDATLEPSRQAILDTPVIVDASENQLVDGQIQNFLVAFYPIIRDFPQWLQVLLDRSPAMGREFFTDNIPEFATAVAATNYAVEGVAQKISEKALRGLAKNEKIGPRGRWWLEEHAKYDDEHPIHALEIIKDCVKRGGDSPDEVTEAALESLKLMRFSMEASYYA